MTSNANTSATTLPFREESRLPPAVREFQTQYYRLRCYASAQRMWDRMLTQEERDRLGNDLDRSYQELGGTVRIWMRLRGVSLERAVIDIACGIGFLRETDRDWLLRETGECFRDGEQMLAEAMSHSRLVVLDRPRQAYWNAERIEIEWDTEPALWSFFWELCQQSKRSDSLRPEHISEMFRPSAFSNRKSRLVNHANFPATMVDAIEAVSGEGYRLNLLPQDIRIFLADEQTVVTEWTG